MSSRTGPQGAGRHLFAVPDVAGGDAGEVPPATSALAQVAELAARGASGELVCSSRGDEVHVFLQGGRIAWASSTRQRRAFTEHLKTITGADDELIEAVVTECSRTRRPIGEGLIAWKVATADQVRASLLHQIRMALASAAQEPETRTLFLERDRYRYDTALTFPLAEVIAAGVADASRRVAPPPPAPPPAAAHASRDAVIPARTAPRDPAADLAATDGFAAAAVLSGRGEPLAVIGDGARLGAVAGITHQLLQESQRLAIDLGAGLCRQLHIEAEDAHLLLYSTRGGPAPGAAGPGALLRIVLVLRDLSHVALAKHRLAALAAGLDADARPG